MTRKRPPLSYRQMQRFTADALARRGIQVNGVKPTEPAPEGDTWVYVQWIDSKSEVLLGEWVLRSTVQPTQRIIVRDDGTVEGDDSRDPYR